MPRSPESLVELRAEVAKTRDLLARQRAFLQEFVARDLRTLGRGQAGAMVVAGVLTDVYTCAETLFWRIVQACENHVPADRWHAKVLRRMTLCIETVRERVLGDDTFGLLDELRRFRHFRRYYFALEYDWAKLEYLLGVYGRVGPLLERDLVAFDGFLERLSTCIRNQRSAQGDGP